MTRRRLRDLRCEFWATETQRDAYRTAASRAGVTLSAWLRRVADAAASASVPTHGANGTSRVPTHETSPPEGSSEGT
jgi:hypothetical protein